MVSEGIPKRRQRIHINHSFPVPTRLLRVALCPRAEGILIKTAALVKVALKLETRILEVDAVQADTVEELEDNIVAVEILIVAVELAGPGEGNCGIGDRSWALDFGSFHRCCF